MQWEIVIGIETHTQLSTQSKIFSGAATTFGAIPNAQACAIDIALPGVLPVLNKGAVERAIKFGLAVGAKISPRSVFARKNYFYPDLPKGYQISQYELPIVIDGSITIQIGDTQKIIHLTRAHLEEDAGKSLHENFQGMSGIDLNRAGTPLLEIVTEPEMRSAAEAVAYAKTLHSLVRWIGICDGNMQEGSFRCDANVSVRPKGTEKLGTRCEIKNLNSFRFIERAIEYEVARQIDILEDGGKIIQETRLYDSVKDETRPMRSKEDAQDYRYFPDPDLLPLGITDKWINEIRATLPELPTEKCARYIKRFNLSEYDATLLTASREMADYFEQTVENLLSLGASEKEAAKLTASWLNGELSNVLNADQVDIGECELSSKWLASLLIRIQDGTISRNGARGIFVGMRDRAKNIRAMKSGNQRPGPTDEFSIDAMIENAGAKQISDVGAIEKVIDEVLAANPQQVADYRNGKEKAFNSLIGQAMKATKGKANPAQLNEILKKKLAN